MIYEQKYFDNLIKNIPNKFMKCLNQTSIILNLSIKIFIGFFQIVKKICLRMNNFVISN